MSHSLSAWFDVFLVRLKDGGWGETFAVHGWNLTAESSQAELLVKRDLPGFNEFSFDGKCAVSPGEPALSLLYHALMHPGVISEAITYWPDLDDIDTLENYIYSLAYSSLCESVAQEFLSTLTPVVMAYEYRVTNRTPHKMHADLVYSRTGVGRVGTHEPQYSARRRCFNTTIEDGSGGTRVQPAKYGVFLCQARRSGEDVAVQGKKHSGDNARVFYKPVCKLFDGQKIGGKTIAVTFDAFHQNDKLQRMVTKGKLAVEAKFNLDAAPFIYRSDNDDFVATQLTAGNITVWRKPQEMCRIAKQAGDIVTFKVPKESLLWLKRVFAKLNIGFFYNNRRYTSLRVGQSPLWAPVDYLLNSVLKKIGSDKRVFLSPRHAGEFTNIRHIVAEDGRIIDLNFQPKGEFKNSLSAGNYPAVMYEDAVAEGYVQVEIGGLKRSPVKAKPAYSLMTAPDFMPRVGNIDIYQYEDNFVTGGPRALCEGRLPVNLRLRFPSSRQRVFAENDQTLTAIVSKVRIGEVASSPDEYDTTHYMTDEASDVFAPGWDITYTRENILSPAYYHTAGLGSPFLEDVKLCAAANGMWPAASPDAARTFRRTTRTALPLTDDEIGLSPMSALGERHSHRGWDGEYGPYLEELDGHLVVNYASIERSDYISNYDEGYFDFSRLRKINRPEADRRLADIARVNTLLLDGKKLQESDVWLVSFIAIDENKPLKEILNLPQSYWSRCELSEERIPVTNTGYFYIFAKYTKSSKSSHVLKRRIQPIDELIFVTSLENDAPNIHKVML